VAKQKRLYDIHWEADGVSRVLASDVDEALRILMNASNQRLGRDITEHNVTDVKRADGKKMSDEDDGN